MTQQTNQPPADRVRLGAVQSAIWANVNGDDRVHYSVTFERRYRDADGKWQSSASFGRDELLTLAKVADMANTVIHGFQVADRSDVKAAEAVAA